MKINKDKINSLARLAKLEIHNNELDETQKDIDNMLNFVKKIDELDTSKPSPLTHIHQKNNVYREDIEKTQDIKSKILENTPNHNSDYIKVPKVLKK